MTKSESKNQEVSRAARFRMDGPGDLLAKLRYDKKRITAASTREISAYATIDAAIATWSIPDWCHEAFLAREIQKNLEETKNEMKAAVPGLEACQVIANAAKHYVTAGHVDVRGTIISFGPKTLDPKSWKISRSSGALAFIYWAGESRPADEFLTEVAFGLDDFLRGHMLDGRCSYLSAILDDQD